MSLSDEIGPFTAIPNWVLEMIPQIGADGLAMYVYLKRHADKNGECFPAYDRMQEAFNVSRPKVSNMLKKLVAAGLITKRRRFSASTIYCVISSKNELMDTTISSKFELPLVQNLNPNKINFNKIKEDIEEPFDPPPPSPEYQAMLELLEEVTGLRAQTNKDSETIETCIKQGIIKQDIQGALQFFADQQKVARSINHLEGSILYQRDKRVQKKNARKTILRKQPETEQPKLTPEQIAEFRRARRASQEAKT